MSVQIFSEHACGGSVRRLGLGVRGRVRCMHMQMHMQMHMHASDRAVDHDITTLLLYCFTTLPLHYLLLYYFTTILLYYFTVGSTTTLCSRTEVKYSRMFCRAKQQHTVGVKEPGDRTVDRVRP